MAFYSFVATTTKPVGIPDPMIVLGAGVNVFTAETKNLEGLLNQLRDKGVEVIQVNKLDDHQEIMPGEVLPLLEDSHNLPQLSAADETQNEEADT